MASTASAEFRALVEEYPDPYLRQTLGQAQAVDAVEMKGDRAHVRVVLGFPTGGYQEEFERGLRAFVAARGGPNDLQVELVSRITAHAVQRQLSPMGGIGNVVAVASGKGGVGKSTVAANLALAWARQGARVGILDADIYGPSQPIMLGLVGQHPSSPDGKVMTPLTAHGVVANSIGFLIDPEQPMVWRGPMVTQALTDLLTRTAWGELDYLVIDMPPGTGDIQLTLSQRVPVAGAVIVTTPQDIALADARKGLKMFEKVNVPVLGIVENMSYFQCPECGTRSDIFGHGGARHEAERLGVPFLGEIPLHMSIRTTSDDGNPVVASDPDGPHAAIYRAIGTKVRDQLQGAIAAA
jgi:ATP-binding protein involved in chromosome partitioning